MVWRCVLLIVASASSLGCLDLGDVEDEQTQTNGDSGVGGSGGFPSGGGGSSAGGQGGCDCVPEAPISWGGPAILYLGAGSVLPACPPSFPTNAAVKRSGTLNAPPASCSACTCGPEDFSCDDPSPTLYQIQTGSSPNCFVSAGAQKLTPGVCKNSWVTPLHGDDVIVGALNQSGSGCPPSGGTPSVTAAAWSDGASLCVGDVVVGNCEPGEVCSPKPPGAFAQTHCVYHDGDVECPSGYPQKQMLWGETIVDTRACSGCACSAPSGGQPCQGNLTAYDGANCSGASFPVPLSGTCTDAPFGISSLKFDLTSGSGGTCTPSGGQPIGTASGTEPMTVCCVL